MSVSMMKHGIWLTVSLGLIAGATTQVRGQDAKDVGETVAQLLPRLESDDPGTIGAAAGDLERLCIEASRPGAEKERRALARAILPHLDPKVSVQARILLIDQLGLIGKFEVVGPLGRILTSDDAAAVREAARSALERLPVVTSKAKLRAALEATDGNLRLGVLHSLGLRRDSLGVQNLLSAAVSDDADTRVAAVEALAMTGEINAIPVVEEALEGSKGVTRQRVLSAYLRLADALVDNAERGSARRIYVRAMDMGTPARCAALLGFAYAGLQSEVGRIVGFVTSDDVDPQVRHAAIQAASSMRGARMTKAVSTALAKATGSERRRDLITILGRRGDPAARRELVKLAASETPPLRALILRSLGGVEPQAAASADPATILPILFDALDGEPEVTVAAELVLSKLPSAAVREAIAQEFGSATASSRAALVRVIGARGETESAALVVSSFRDADRDVRLAALEAAGRLGSTDSVPQLIEATQSEDAGERQAAQRALILLPAEPTVGLVVAAARQSATEPGRAALIGVLARHRPADALSFLKEQVRSAHAEVRLAALGVLARYPDVELTSLLLPFTSSDSADERRVAAAGTLRHAPALAAGEPETALRIYAAALQAPDVDKDIETALEGLGKVGGTEQLTIVLPLLDSATHARTATRTALSLASQYTDDEQAEAVTVLRQIAQSEADEPTATEASERLRKLGVDLELAEARGFVTHWWILGPLARVSDPLESRSPLPGAIDLGQTLSDAGQSYEWKYHRESSVQGIVRLETIGYGTAKSIAYLYAEITVSGAQDAVLKLGSDDQVACWLNGTLVHKFDRGRSIKVDQDTVPVSLQAGTNSLLLKVGNGGGGWGACLRLTDTAGQALRYDQRRS